MQPNLKLSTFWLGLAMILGFAGIYTYAAAFGHGLGVNLSLPLLAVTTVVLAGSVLKGGQHARSFGIVIVAACLALAGRRMSLWYGQEAGLWLAIGMGVLSTILMFVAISKMDVRTRSG